MMAPLHSLVDDLRMKNRCHQKEGVTLTSQCLQVNNLRLLTMSIPTTWRARRVDIPISVNVSIFA